LPILWAPVQLKWSLAAFSASACVAYIAGTPPEPAAGAARPALENRSWAPIAAAAREGHGLEEIDTGRVRAQAGLLSTHPSECL
jgi:hypothetical protein